jgi:hypothetical protein
MKIHSQQPFGKPKLAETVVEFVKENNCCEYLGEVLCNGITGTAAGDQFVKVGNI